MARLMHEGRDAADSISAFVDHAWARGVISDQDVTWARNVLLCAVGEASAEFPPSAPEALSDEALEEVAVDLHALARKNGLAPTVGDGAHGFLAYLMGLVMPRPAEVARAFADRAKRNPQEATDWFHALSTESGYIRRDRIARNIAWTASSEWGDLEITINLSKPEKDPQAIARAASAPRAGAYPACQLCVENEGYAGRPDGCPSGAHPARQNLRIVPLALDGEAWGLQYSPYAYYQEHCIAMGRRHEPMRIDRSTFEKLFDFVDALPHYFVGSNADLPIVGGSILSHNHFQGGRHVFPMDRAPLYEVFELPGAEGVQAGIVRWPMTVIRLSGSDRTVLADASERILGAWRAWSDPSVGVVSHTGQTPHNTITPIVRRLDEGCEINLVLRCNVTTQAHPLGVFHPHTRWHHIKRENIGLIEVMGLAILPPRLERELDAVAQGLLSGADLEADALTAPHAAWAREIASRYSDLCVENVREVVKEEVGQVFAQVLADAGVFKWDEAGRAALHRFLNSL